MLVALDYVYPYHQAIGFYMSRAGYQAEDLKPLLSLGLRYKFYLTHGILDSLFDSDWQIYYPPRLQDRLFPVASG
jgi:hypothetical protein